MNRIITTFTDFDDREWRDRLAGGKADGKEPDDFDYDDIRIGTSVEKEHTSNPDIATEIAMDHLVEDPEYYDKLIASGIADEEDAKILYDELKDDNDRKKAEMDIIDYIEEDDDEYEPIGDEEEDELGPDKADIDDDDEMILDDTYEKNIQEKIKYKKMEKSIKDYSSFVNETNKPPVNPENDVNSPGPERAISKENKYKFQLPYEKKVEKKLLEYSFTFYKPEGENTNDKNFILIDIQNLTYSIVSDEVPGVREIDSSKLKFIFENL